MVGLMIKKNKTRDHIEKLYDSFAQKDMPLKEFKRRYKKATDPGALQQDLGKVIEHRQMRQTQKMVMERQKKVIDDKILY